MVNHEPAGIEILQETCLDSKTKKDRARISSGSIGHLVDPVKLGVARPQGSGLTLRPARLDDTNVLMAFDMCLAYN